MSRIQNVSRRGFLKDVLSGGAFVLGAHFVPDLPPGVVRRPHLQTLPLIARFFIRMCFLVLKRMGRFTSLRTVPKWETAAVPHCLGSWRTNWTLTGIA